MVAVSLVEPRQPVRLPERASCAELSDLCSATVECAGLRDCAAAALEAPSALEAHGCVAIRS